MWKDRSCKLLGLLAALCLGAPILPLAAQDLYTLKVDVPVVSVDVAVADSNGEPVSQLTQEDFQIFEDGALQEIRFFSPVSAPYNVFLLFDRSGSTRGKWPFMRNAVVRFIERLRPQDRIAMGSFDEKFDVHLRWSAELGKAIRALDEIVKPREVNGTRFYAALERALSREFRGVSGRRAVIVLTDGQDTPYLMESDGDLRKLRKTAREQRIPIYIIGLENDAARYAILPQTRLYLAASRSNMEELAEITGGRLLFPKTLNEIMPLYGQIGREFATSYSFGYISSRSEPDGGFRRIEVKARDNSLRLTQSRSGYTGR